MRKRKLTYYEKVLAAWMKRWRAWLKRHPKPKPVPPTPAPSPSPVPVPKPPKPKPGPVEMFDDIDVPLIPVTAEAVAGYVDGKWPTYGQLSKIPRVKFKLSIAVFSRDDANVLDVEPGDATIAEIVAWVKREHARGEKRPDIYTAVSWAEKAVNTLTAAGFEYGVHYRLWTAHYTHTPHLCSHACGFGFTKVAHATQWTDRAGGKSLDESLCAADFFA